MYKLRLWKCLLLAYWVCFADNSVSDEVNSTPIGPGDVMSFGFWHESFGDMEIEQTICISSPDAAGENFEIEVRHPIEYEIDHQGGSNDEVDIEFQVRNLISGAPYEALKRNQDAKEKNTFQQPGCPNGYNVGLKIIVRAVNVIGMDDGLYSEVFTLRARQNQNTTIDRDFTVELRKMPVLRISNLKDMDFHWAPGEGNLMQTNTFCIYSDVTYRLDFESSNSTGTNHFWLKSQAGNSLPYIVRFKNLENITTFQRAYNLEGITGLTSNASDPSCSTGDNATLRIWINSVRMLAQSAGVYNDTLILRVSPSD